MNILQVHNSYREFGGEDVVVEQECKLLRKDHRVRQFMAHNNEELDGLIARFKLLFNTHYSRKSKERIRRELISNDTDVMHVHNFFPLHTPSIFDAAEEEGVPSVLTLHNYRLIHPNGLLFHKGRIDERSIRKSAWSCVPDGVYRGSVLQSAVVAHMIEYHRKRKTWEKVPTLFIALTQFAKEKFIEGGLPGEKIVVKPNFIEDPLNRLYKSGKEGNYFFYAGRISKEKGVAELVDCWLQNRFSVQLRIAGNGPERTKLQKRSEGSSSIRWLGQIPRKEVLEQMRSARALLFPSIWYEGFPMTLVEALATGCPSIVSNIGSQAEIIEDGRTGLHFKSGNTADLAEAVHKLTRDDTLYNHLAENARRTYLEKYTPGENERLLLAIYEQVIGDR